MDTIQINFDALKKDNWSEKEASNVKLIIDFIEYFTTLARETFRTLVKNFINEKLPVN